MRIAKLDCEGMLELPSDLVAELNLTGGVELHVEKLQEGIRILRPLTWLGKLYIEPTNQCNLSCRTCIRNGWEDASLGFMEVGIFEKLMEGVSNLPKPPLVFFGGYGEPLLHPEILRMVRRAKHMGCKVELITNGTLLDRAMSLELIKAELDRLWVSLDGITSDGYGSLRPSSPLDLVLENLRGFHDMATGLKPFTLPKPALGLVFVATRKNLHELSQAASLAARLGVTRFLVTNVLPHTKDMTKEVLFDSGLQEAAFEPSMFKLHLPRMDSWELGRSGVISLLRSGFSLSLAGAELWRAHNRCPFVEEGSFVLNWKGEASPCLPLLYNHAQYLNDFERKCRRFVIGALEEKGLVELWLDEKHMFFRKRVREFAFSPCTVCGGCDLLESNEEDCFGNTHPTCGGCLFAQGVVRCP